MVERYCEECGGWYEECIHSYQPHKEEEDIESAVEEAMRIMRSTPATDTALYEERVKRYVAAMVGADLSQLDGTAHEVVTHLGDGATYKPIEDAVADFVSENVPARFAAPIAEALKGNIHPLIMCYTAMFFMGWVLGAEEEYQRGNH